MPTPQLEVRLNRVQGFIQDTKQLAPDELMGISIWLEKSLSNVTAQFDEYQAPAGFDFVVWEAEGYLRIPALGSEPAAPLSYVNLELPHRWLVKAQNCTFLWQYQDLRQKVTEGAVPPLSSIMPPWGTKMMWPLESPLRIKESTRTRITFQLQDSTSGIVGGATIYGVKLVGALIKK